MPAAYRALTIEKGATFLLVLRRKRKADDTEIDTTGSTVRMMVRHPDWKGEIVPGFNLSTASSPPEITVSTDPDHPGTITIEVSATVTAEIERAICKGAYDIEVEDTDGRVKRLMEGPVKFIPNVTRPSTSGG